MDTLGQSFKTSKETSCYETLRSSQHGEYDCFRGCTEEPGKPSDVVSGEEAEETGACNLGCQRSTRYSWPFSCELNRSKPISLNFECLLDIISGPVASKFEANCWTPPQDLI